MDLFTGYLRDFEEYTNEAREQISSLAGLTGDALRHKENEIENILADASQVISGMNVAIPNLSNKQQAQDNVEKCKVKMRELNKSFKLARESAKGKSDRLNLLGGTDAESLASVKARTELLTDTQNLENGADILAQTNQRVVQIGFQGAETLDVMSGQRERMESQRSKIDVIRSKIRDSDRIIRAIASRMSINDVMKLVIILVLIVLICVIIYLRWIRKVIVITPPSPPLPAPVAPPAPLIPSEQVPIELK